MSDDATSGFDDLPDSEKAIIWEIDKEETREKIAIMQAFVDCPESIQYKNRCKGVWHDVTFPNQTLSWDWVTYDYRIKPTPQTIYCLRDIRTRIVGRDFFCMRENAEREKDEFTEIVEFKEVIK